jgi:hypothetical protein
MWTPFVQIIGRVIRGSFLQKNIFGQRLILLLWRDSIAGLGIIWHVSKGVGYVTVKPFI